MVVELEPTCCAHDSGTTFDLGKRLEDLATLAPPRERKTGSKANLHGSDVEDRSFVPQAIRAPEASQPRWEPRPPAHRFRQRTYLRTSRRITLLLHFAP
jgi:hypothetical protein